MKDPLLPTLSIHDASIPPERQQCTLLPSREAKSFKAGKTSLTDFELRSKDTALAEGMSLDTNT